jgi:hypothetical protein
MRTAGGGGGSRIVLNPVELRRGATRLRGAGGDLKTLAGRLNAAPLPAMPADVAADVGGGIGRVFAQLSHLVDPLATSATELNRRALWGEIADQLVAGYPLTGAQLAEFMAGLRDGTLVRYAEPWQAELAGAYVASLYSDNYKEPDKLIELARLLQANGGSAETSGAFMAGFVERFGTRIADIPRVIQAMDWTPGTMLGPGDDPMVDWDLGRQLWQDGYELKVDPVELLAAFSMALALGTASGRVSQQVEHDIAWDDDRWAVAQLLHEGRFGANFLKETFQSIVVPDIQRDAVRMGPDLTGYMAIGLGDGHGPGIPTDERQLVLNALLRNPEGAALALSTPLPDEVHIASRWAPVDTRDPVAVLYAADWNDDGHQLADLYRGATDWAQSHAAAPGTSEEGNKITLQLIERVSNAQRDDLGVVTDALAHDIATHHVPGLIDMAGGSGSFDPDAPVGKGFVDLTSHRIVLDGRQVEQLVNAMADREPADKVFVQALGDGQASYLAEMVREHPEQAESWGYKVGALDQYVLNAHDVDREVAFGEASDRQKLGISVLSTTLTALTEGTPYGVLVGPATTLIDIGTSPSALDMSNHNFADKLDTRSTVRALIATAGHEYGHAPGPAPDQERYLVKNGHLIAYSDQLPREIRHEFDQWVLSAETGDPVVGRAIDNATQAMDDHARN